MAGETKGSGDKAFSVLGLQVFMYAVLMLLYTVCTVWESHGGFNFRSILQDLKQTYPFMRILARSISGRYSDELLELPRAADDGLGCQK